MAKKFPYRITVFQIYDDLHDRNNPYLNWFHNGKHMGSRGGLLEDYHLLLVSDETTDSILIKNEQDEAYWSAFCLEWA